MNLAQKLISEFDSKGDAEFIVEARFVSGETSVVKLENVGDDYFDGRFRGRATDDFSKHLETVNINTIQRYRRI